jgi:hypothetical protein
MKTTKFSNKLRLQKETIVDLNSKEMLLVNGGEKLNAIAISFPVLTYTRCMTQCPSNDSAPLACCALC